MPVVGKTLKLTPICIKVCINNNEISPVSIILNTFSFVSFIFLKILYANNMNANINRRIIIIPNSSEITDTIKSVCASGILEFKVPSPIPLPKKPPSIIASDAFSACEKLLDELSKNELILIFI